MYFRKEKMPIASLIQSQQINEQKGIMIKGCYLSSSQVTKNIKGTWAFLRTLIPFAIKLNIFIKPTGLYKDVATFI